MIKSILLICAGLVSGALLMFNFFFRGKELKSKIAYVDTIYLYEKSEIQKHYTQVLDVKNKRNKYILDSLYNSIKKEKISEEQANYVFGKKREELELEIRKLESEYTAKVWNQITEFTLQYGKQNDYDFIMGANGQGNVMYARESNNVSEEVLKFINEKYSDD